MPDAVGRLNSASSRWSPRQLARRALLACVPSRQLLASAPGSGAVYLTFDDGPHPEYTPRLLDVLAACQLPATFFLLGSNCVKYPEIVRRIVSEGHAIGSHSYSHLDARVSRTRDYLADVRRCEEELCGILGITPRLYRPPYGRLSVSSFLSLVFGGRTIVLWSVDVRDYETGPAEMEAFLTANPLNDGDILLMHDVHPHAAEMLPFIFRQVTERGLTCRALPMEVGRLLQPEVAVPAK